MSKLSYWFDWRPEGRISADLARSEPTKPSKPGFVGSVGAASANTTEIQPSSAPASGRQPGQNPAEAHPSDTLKGYAVCLYSDLVGENLWIVADEEDAERLIEQGERRGATYTRAESRLVTRIKDSEIVRQIHEFKREFDTRILPPTEESGRSP